MIGNPGKVTSLIIASDGYLLWKKNLEALTGLNGTGLVLNVNVTVSRSTPTVAGELLIFGIYGPAVVIAVKRLTGELAWKRKLDDHAASIVTTSGTYYNGKPLFSSPKNRRLPEKENNQTIPSHPDSCVEPDNHLESILAFDLESSEIKRYHQLGGYDVWFFACSNVSTPNCPPGPNPDAYFGEAPMILSIYVKGRKKDIVAAVQKSGFAWALDRDNGSLVWSTKAGPGGYIGGGIWEVATDEKRVYTNIANSENKNFTLTPSGKTVTAGGWVAMDARDAKILWLVVDPRNSTGSGPVTVANGVPFGGSTYKRGPIYAINTKNGEILWSYDTSYCFWRDFTFSAGTSLFAVCVR
ncbi:polyvinylalcohol dehydrogenase-like [Melia azedarach]|uniref:Polyvinylalcohol dehydrogenase-like n=1 Tax=Melia azedarach TaxID=155640 RepID=A0ACC1X6C4_MELAZ|nr:polyvinylalcohol dehydrogenase-like [Melia azedarach]